MYIIFKIKRLNNVSMKVLLIQPPMTSHKNYSLLPGIVPQLGLAYIAAVLEEKKHEVQIIDSVAEGWGDWKKSGYTIRYGLSDKEIIRRVETFQPDIVGISSMYTAFSDDALNTAMLVKQINKSIPVIFGGANACIDPWSILNNKNVDLVVKGEGEITFLDIVKKHKNGHNIKNIKGTVSRSGNKIIDNPPRDLIQDLDQIPFPARHLLPMKVYLKQKNKYNMREPYTNLISSRGCPGNCIFCSIHSVWGHRWRGRSPENVVDEMEHLIDNYGIQELHFTDDSMSANKKRMDAICDEIINRDIDIKWTTPNGIAIWSLDERLLLKMKKSGAYRLTFGIESGNNDTQKFIRKNLNLEKAKRLIEYCRRIGVWTICTHIIGFPFETREEMEDTMRFAMDSNPDFATFYLLMPFLGTELHDILKREGLLEIDNNDLRSSLCGTGCASKYFTEDELKKIQIEFYSRFFENKLKNSLKKPAQFIKKMNSFENIIYLVRIGKSFFKIKAGINKDDKFGIKNLE
jgi:anaerobic magnesium-protoporphyrin IX monomethyl ester cyclase